LELQKNRATGQVSKVGHGRALIHALWQHAFHHGTLFRVAHVSIVIVFLFFCLVGFVPLVSGFGRVSGVPLLSGVWSGFGGSACFWCLVGFREVPLFSGFWSGFGGSACFWFLGLCDFGPFFDTVTKRVGSCPS